MEERNPPSLCSKVNNDLLAMISYRNDLLALENKDQIYDILEYENIYAGLHDK